MRQKLRMIISHASGGHLSEPGDVDRSVNDICVEISRHKNDIWAQAQESALKGRPEAVTDELLVEALKQASWDLRYAKREFGRSGDKQSARMMEVAQTAADAALSKVSPLLVGPRAE